MTNRLQGWLLAAAFMAASLAPALAQPVTVSGYVEDTTTGERIPGAHLYLPSLENDEVDARPMTNPHYGYLRALHFVHHTIDPLAYPPTIACTLYLSARHGKGVLLQGLDPTQYSLPVLFRNALQLFARSQRYAKPVARHDGLNAA